MMGLQPRRPGIVPMGSDLRQLSLAHRGPGMHFLFGRLFLFQESCT